MSLHLIGTLAPTLVTFSDRGDRGWRGFEVLGSIASAFGGLVFFAIIAAVLYFLLRFLIIGTKAAQLYLDTNAPAGPTGHSAHPGPTGHAGPSGDTGPSGDAGPQPADAGHPMPTAVLPSSALSDSPAAEPPASPAAAPPASSTAASPASPAAVPSAAGSSAGSSSLSDAPDFSEWAVPAGSGAEGNSRSLRPAAPASDLAETKELPTPDDATVPLAVFKPPRAPRTPRTPRTPNTSG